MVFRDQQEFIDAGPEMYTNWGRYFGRLHIHPSSGHPDGYPEIHLVYKLVILLHSIQFLIDLP